MPCECTRQSAKTDAERKTLRIALMLNVMMFVVGMTAGLWAQSTGLMADALDMLADASAYALALIAVTRNTAFKQYAARWSGVVLLILGLGIVIDVVRRGLLGSEPEGQVMMAFSLVSLVVNVSVVRMLSKYRDGEVHLRATWRFTRVDVLANLGVFVSGLTVTLTSFRFADLVMGLGIGLYVVKEAIEILSSARKAMMESDQEALMP